MVWTKHEIRNMLRIELLDFDTKYLESRALEKKPRSVYYQKTLLADGRIDEDQYRVRLTRVILP